MFQDSLRFRLYDYETLQRQFIDEKQERHEEQCPCSSKYSCHACVAWQVGQVGEGEREVDEDRQSGDRVCWGARVNGRKLRKYIIVESSVFLLNSSSNFILEFQCSTE